MLSELLQRWVQRVKADTEAHPSRERERLVKSAQVSIGTFGKFRFFKREKKVSRVVSVWLLLMVSF
jgi:nucleoid DNA-binding protein